MKFPVKYHYVYIILVVLLANFAPVTIFATANNMYKWIRVTIYKDRIIIIKNVLYKEWSRDYVYRGALIANLTMFSKSFRETLAN